MAAVAKDGELFVVSFDTLHGGGETKLHGFVAHV